MAPNQSGHVTVQVWVCLFMTVHGVRVCVCVKLSWIHQKLIAIHFCRQLGYTLDNTPTSKFTTPLVCNIKS